jgi:hypothetical protein
MQPETPEQPATPPGTTNEDLDHRSEIARFLGKDIWPADRDTLVATAEQNSAPDAVLADLRRLPADQDFTNMQDVARALGIGTEQHGF